MRHGLLWLAVVDLRQTWLRSSLAALAIALAVLAVTFFAGQVSLREAEVLADYEQAGATTFVADLNAAGDGEIGELADAIRSIAGVGSLNVPYNGVGLGLIADAFFLVFENERQKEYLGARTTVLGVDAAFDSLRDYYVDFHDLNPEASPADIGIPLLPTSGVAGSPARNEVAVASGVADYVGVRPNAEATVDLIYARVSPPIVRRFEGLRLIGTFDAAGPDQGRFDPFWRFAAQGEEVLTVRRPDAAEGVSTSLPILLNHEVVREFVTYVRDELAARELVSDRSLTPDQFVIRANSIAEVPSVEAAVKSLLEERGLAERCDSRSARSFCLRLPERNNFQSAQREQGKLGRGGSFFQWLLLALIATGASGLQIQTVLARWRDIGVFQAVGFSPSQVLSFYAIELGAVLFGSVAIAAAAILLAPFAIADSLATFGVAVGVSVIAAGSAALPVLLWPLWQRPAELLRVSA